MCICHGLSEYQGRYEKLGHTMAESGILTFGQDLGEFELPYSGYVLQVHNSTNLPKLSQKKI